MSRLHEHSGVGCSSLLGRGGCLSFPCSSNGSSLFTGWWWMPWAPAWLFLLPCWQYGGPSWEWGSSLNLFHSICVEWKAGFGDFFNLEPVVSGFSGAQSRIHRRQTEQLEKLSLCNSTDCKVPHCSAFSLLFRVDLFAFYIMSWIFSCT